MTLKQALRAIRRRRKNKETVVFTNGCFDLLHAGHVRLLRQAKSHGDFLVVGVNSDRSVRRLKGPGRPILPLKYRIEMLSALEPVDCVVSFSEDTPERLIRAIRPDVLIKGGDWKVRRIAGAGAITARGGRVVPGLFIRGLSTTRLIQRIRRSRP